MPTGLAHPYDYSADELTAASRSRYFLGLSFILLQCIVWILAAILAQNVYESHKVSPFVLSYIGMSLLALLLPIRFLMEFCQSQSDDETLVRQPTMDTVDHQMQQAKQVHDYVDIAMYSTNKLIHDKTTQWGHKKHFLAALLLTPAMFLADWAFNTALATTSVASATVLVSTQSVFVFGLAILTRLETFSLWKLLGVLGCVVGTALTTVDDASEEGNVIMGDAMALAAALMYAAYTIKVRIFCPENEELYSMQLLLGYCGTVCFISLLPVGAFVIWSNLHALTPYIFGVIVIKGIMDFCVTDYCLFRAIVLTNVTVATVGLGLTIPMAFLADWVLGKSDGLGIYGIFGALAITIGFVIVNVAPEHTSTDEKLSSQEFIDESEIDSTFEKV